MKRLTAILCLMIAGFLGKFEVSWSFGFKKYLIRGCNDA